MATPHPSIAGLECKAVFDARAALKKPRVRVPAATMRQAALPADPDLAGIVERLDSLTAKLCAITAQIAAA
jgi:hypothetical protein